MSPRLPALVLVTLLALVLVARQDRAGGSTAASPTPEFPVADTPPTRPAMPAGRRPLVAPLPGIRDADAATPSIDLQSILAVRRRIAREGAAVYLDSLLARTDSIIVRWPDDATRLLRVRVVPDTALPGWTPDAPAAVRTALARWSGNAAGIRLEEVSDTTSAQIEVSFVPAVSASGEFGVTQLDWTTDGVARRATIQIALRSAENGPALPRDVLERVAAHEFGHALGLPHSAERRDLMHPSTTVGSPTRRDQATLQLLYVLPPGSIRTP
jgi:predicted Zn-dependent protease